MAPLQLEDGHDLCPSCLGFEHLKEGLSDDPCMNCGIMPWAVRAARLAEVEQLLGSTSSIGHLTPAQRLVPDQTGQSKRQAAEAAGPTPAKTAKGPRLASKVDQLTAELNTMKSLFLAFQSGTGAEPPDDFVPSAASLESEDDVLSMASSAGQFNEYEPEVLPQMGASQPSAAGSRSSTHSSTGGVEDCSMGAIIRMALAQGCQTYGPWAIYGPQRCPIRPA